MALTWTEWLQERSRALPYEVKRPTQPPFMYMNDQISSNPGR